MLVGTIQGAKIYKAPAEDKRTRRDGTPREPKRFGKIHFPVFSSDGCRVVGFMVRLPDVVGMIKQPDRFVARDALGIYEGALVVSDEKANFDKAAEKRLGIDLETCFIWTGMDAVTTSGKKLGYCADASFNFRTGAVEHFQLTSGGASSMLIGNLEVPASYLKGYRDGAMIMDDRTLELQHSGGAAAKAAEASVVVGAKVKKGAAALDEKGSRAVDKGSRALGKQLGKTKGMFSAFASEYRNAAGTSKKTKGSKKK